MADYYWPATLPHRPVKDGYTRGTANNTLRTAMEYGPAKTRRRTSAGMAPLALVHVLDGSGPGTLDADEQKQVLLDFYAVVDCTLPFWLPDPENPAQYIKVRFKAGSEESGLEFKPVYACAWQVELQLEVYPYVAKPRA